MKSIKKLLFVCLTLALFAGFGLVSNSPANASEPFIAQVKAFGFNFAPRGWAHCDGQLLPISSNTALFSLIGTIYGGDGRTTTALPDLQGRFAMHYGHGLGLTNRRLGEKAGNETITLGTHQIPNHTHALRADSNNGDADSPTGNVLARHGRNGQYSSETPNVKMKQGVILPAVGGGQAHDNMPPYLSVNYCIALVGTYPSRN